jgi:tetratricopeptide (TPR) repeat protein
MRHRTGWDRVIHDGHALSHGGRSIAAMEALDELAVMVERDPVHVAAAAAALATASRAAGDAASESRALALVGRARRMLDEVELAERALRGALDAAARAADDELAADAHLAMAGVLSIGSRIGDAFDHLEQVDRLGSVQMRFMGRLQRAVLCKRAGRIDEAMALYDEVIPQLRRDGHELLLARMLGNRSEVHTRAGNTAAAIDDLEAARSLFDRLGQEYVGLQVRHNLAWAVAYAGDVPQALRLLDEVTAAFARLGHEPTVPMVSRAEILLAAGLSSDAAEPAADAARRLMADGNRSTAAEAWLLVAHAHRLDGDHRAAAAAAATARDLFAELGVDGWRWAAEFEIVRNQAALGELGADALDHLDDVAAGLDTSGNARSHAVALALAATVAAEHHDLGRARRLVDDAARVARRHRALESTLAVAQARAAVARAGDPAGARRHLRAGLDELARDRALFAAADARDATTSLAGGITDLAMRVAASDGRPAQVFEWIERVRAATPVARPALPPVDDDLATRFARLRAAAVEVRRAELDGAPTTSMLAELRQLEHAVRARLLVEQVRPARPERPARLGQLRAVLGERELVAVAAAGSEYIAVVVGGRSRTVRLGERGIVDRAVERVQRALHGTITAAVDAGAPSSVLEARHRQLDAAVQQLDALLVAPLHLGAGAVVLVVPARLHGVPWRGLPGMRGRAVSLAPSATWWSATASAAASTASSGSALAVAGPRLAQAPSEVAAIGGVHRTAEILAGPQATVAAVIDGFTRASIAHVSAHGRFRADNALWSTLELADGPLTVYELERVTRVPATIVLASCHSALGASRSGDGLVGLSSTLLGLGATSVVVSVAALPDAQATTEAMVALHRGLSSGHSAAHALRDAPPATGMVAALVDAAVITHGVG